MSIAKILDLYARRGHSLISNGLNEAALPLNDAVDAVRLFAEQKWRVLGGDVYQVVTENTLESTHENWFYEGDDAQKSIVAASEFMDRLNGRAVYVVFVIDCAV